MPLIVIGSTPSFAQIAIVDQCVVAVLESFIKAPMQTRKISNLTRVTIVYPVQSELDHSSDQGAQVSVCFGELGSVFGREKLENVMQQQIVAQSE